MAVVGISSNDAASYPADSPEQMVHEAENRGYTFPYLYDETQEVAKAYAPPARPISMYSTKTRSWCTAAKWTPAGPTAAFR